MAHCKLRELDGLKGWLGEFKVPAVKQNAVSPRSARQTGNAEVLIIRREGGKWMRIGGRMIVRGCTCMQLESVALV